jgi:rod shape-determining protein MreD
MDTPAQKLDFAVRAAFPPLITLGFILLPGIPVPWPFFSDGVAPLAFASVCFWVVAMPELFGRRWSFFFGLMQDMLSGGVFGVSAAAYLFADLALRSQAPHFLQRSFGVFWIFYAALAIAVGLLQWGAASLLQHHAALLAPAALRTVLGVCIFPGVAFILGQIQRAFLSRV